MAKQQGVLGGMLPGLSGELEGHLGRLHSGEDPSECQVGDGIPDNGDSM